VPASAPHSFARRNRRITETIDVPGIGSSALAAAAARSHALTKGAGYEWATFDSPFDPRHDTFDIVEMEQTNWIEVRHSFTAAPGARHAHEIRRVYEDDAG
jgi:hypothetical protein